MKKLKAFAYVFKNSATNFLYYKDLKETNVMFSVKYYWFLALVMGLLLSIKTTALGFQLAKAEYADLISAARNMYPDDLIIKSDGKDWEINKEEPLVIPLPGEKREHENLPTNLIIFDHKGTVTEFQNGDTLMLVNTKNLLINDQFNGFRTQPLQGLPAGEYTKDQHNKVLDRGNELIKFIPIIMFGGMFVGTIFMYTVRFMGAYFLALFTMLGARIMNIPMTYLQAFQVALHSFTLPMIIELLLPAVGENTAPWFMTVHLAFVMLILIKLREYGKTAQVKQGTDLKA